MAITDRTRKILWGRSGNLCAYCRRILVEDATDLSDESVVGDEAHIIGERPTAARGSFGVGREDLDEYSNLILLCKVHHKQVDDQSETYSVELLRVMKANHESWVKETLVNVQSKRKQQSTLLSRIYNGKDLLGIVDGSMALLSDHDELETEEEVELIGNFLQNVHDWGDIWSEVENIHRVQTRFSLTKEIKEMESAGLLVFGKIDPRKLRHNGAVIDWPVALIVVVRNTNKSITELGTLATFVIDQ